MRIISMYFFTQRFSLSVFPFVFLRLPILTRGMSPTSLTCGETKRELECADKQLLYDQQHDPTNSERQLWYVLDRQ